MLTNIKISNFFAMQGELMGVMRVARQEKEKVKLGMKEREEEKVGMVKREEEGNQLLRKMQERLKVGWHCIQIADSNKNK